MSSVELVATNTRDGIRLDGALCSSAVEPRWDVEAAVLLHGVGGNFYGGALFDPLVARLLAHGVDVLRVNTRGHDGLFTAGTPNGRRNLGAACEIVDECRYDVAAWVEFLAKRHKKTRSQAPPRIALIGHSLGAVKAIYSQAIEADKRVACVVAISPARLSFELYMASESRAPFSQSIADAEQLVEAGRGAQLFPARFPFAMLMSADAYLDKYGPGDRYDIVKYVNRLQPPSLLMFGERELADGGPAFSGVPTALRGLPKLPSSIDFLELAEADHFYTGVRNEAAESISEWMQSRLGRGP